jgi:AcrR family transcriptional regulator
MASAYERPKDPERIRQALLNCAATIAANQGLPAITISGVCLAAGVTKGALFHHFENKQALVDAMFDQSLEQLDMMITSLMTKDPVTRGRFTRAYVCAALIMDDHVARTWSTLISSLFGDTGFGEKWHAWLAEKLHEHAGTDSGVELEIIRMAADGAWLNSLTTKTMSQERLVLMKDRLVHMTTLTDLS